MQNVDYSHPILYYLDEKSTETLIHAFITCHLDMFNSLLCGLPNSHISKLRRIQNSAARLVTRTRFSDHITPVLRDLHWLPVKFRIIYKTLLLTYKCLHGLAPEYLTDFIQEYRPVCNLRSSFKQKLVPSSVSTNSYAHRSFHHASPELWNKLPLHIKNSRTLNQFKSSLKTYLFWNRIFVISYVFLTFPGIFTYNWQVYILIVQL